jgi:hypothetical protein
MGSETRRRKLRHNFSRKLFIESNPDFAFASSRDGTGKFCPDAVNDKVDIVVDGIWSWAQDLAAGLGYVSHDRLLARIFAESFPAIENGAFELRRTAGASNAVVRDQFAQEVAPSLHSIPH